MFSFCSYVYFLCSAIYSSEVDLRVWVSLLFVSLESWCSSHCGIFFSVIFYHSFLINQFVAESMIWLIISWCSCGLFLCHSCAVSKIIRLISFALATARSLCEYILFRNACILFSYNILVKLSHNPIARLWSIISLIFIVVSCSLICYISSSSYCCNSYILFW